MGNIFVYELPDNLLSFQKESSLSGFLLKKETEAYFMKAEVGIIMGSTSDWETMKHACDILDELGVSYEKRLYLRTGHLI